MNALTRKGLAAALAVFVAAGAAGAALAAGEDCEALAVNKKGEKLSGRHHAAFIERCRSKQERPQVYAACAEKAISKNGKPLKGAAKNASVDKCLRMAKEAHMGQG